MPARTVRDEEGRLPWGHVTVLREVAPMGRLLERRGETSIKWKPTAHVAVEGLLALASHVAGPSRMYGTGSRGRLALIDKPSRA